MAVFQILTQIRDHNAQRRHFLRFLCIFIQEHPAGHIDDLAHRFHHHIQLIPRRAGEPGVLFMHLVGHVRNACRMVADALKVADRTQIQGYMTGLG